MKVNHLPDESQLEGIERYSFQSFRGKEVPCGYGFHPSSGKWYGWLADPDDGNWFRADTENEIEDELSFHSFDYGV